MIEVYGLLFAETADIRPIINLKLTIAKLIPICSKLGKVRNWRTISEKRHEHIGKKSISSSSLALHSIIMEITDIYFNDKHGPLFRVRIIIILII